jgi:hypothetical protein
MSDPMPLKRLRDLPGVMPLERRAQLDPSLAADAARYREDEFDRVSRLNFGVTFEEALDLWDSDESDDPINPIMAFSEHDEAALFHKQGWDVTDEAGRPLLVLKHFNVQLALVIGGLLQLTQTVDPETWGEGLEAEAERFKRQKR